MAALGTWIKALIVVVLLGSVVDFLLPKGDMKRYGGLVVGLVILATVVTPLWTWMHDLGKHVAVPPTQWTNTVSGFATVIESEELHQAEAIVLSMPGIRRCQLSRADDGLILAQVTATPSTPRQRIHRYVVSALKVTTGTESRLVLELHQPR